MSSSCALSTICVVAVLVAVSPPLPASSRAPIRSAASRARAGMTWLWMSIVVRIWLWPQFHDHARVHVLGQQQGGGGVPAVVQPDVADARLLQQPRPVVIVGLLVDRPAIRLGEDEVLVVPLGAGQHPLAQLGGLVPVQFGDER